MKDLITIIKYTVKEAVTKKTFIIVNIIMALIIVAVCNIPNLIRSFVSEEDISTKITIVDQENLLNANSEIFNETFEQLDMDYKVEYTTSKTIEDINKLITDEEIDSAIIIKKDNNTIAFDYVIKEKTAFDEAESIVGIFSNIIKNIQTSNLLVESNIPAEMLEAINSPINYEIKSLEENTGNENFFVAMISSYVLFFAIFYYGYSVSTSVSSEKTSRVMETLITSTTPTKIVIGKTIAMGFVGLSQLVGLIIVAIISYKLFIPSDFTLIEELLSGLTINVPSILICLVYFILGYTVYAFLSAVTGATVSKVEDVQSASGPISFVALISFFLAYFTSTMPTSAASKFASIFPFSSAFSMPGRILAGAATSGEIVLSIIVLLVTVVILATISIRVYSAALLHYGDRLKITDLFKMYKQK